MKKYILAASVVAAALTASAQTKVERTDSLTRITNPGAIEIVETPNGITVKVSGQNDSTVAYTYKNQFKDDVTVITEQEETVSDFGIEIPFMGNSNRKVVSYNGKSSVPHRARWSIITNGFGIGVNGMLSTPQEMDGYRSAGVEFMIANLLGLRYSPWRHGPSFSLGFGVHWDNSFLKNGMTFVRDDDKQSVACELFPEGASKRSSALHVFNLLVPFNIRYDFNRNWGIGAGVWGMFTTKATIWSKYKLDDISYKQSWQGVNRRKFRLSYMFNVRFQDLGLYVKYTPKNAIADGYGPQFKEISAGLMIPM